jgi:hypothetical protein
MLLAFVAGLFIPTVRLPAFALPLLGLLCKPCLRADLAQSFQFDQDILMVQSAIALKCPDPFAGKLRTQAAVENASFLCTGSNLTL